MKLAMLLLLLSAESFKMRSWDRHECHNARFKFRDNRLLGPMTERETHVQRDLLSLPACLSLGKEVV
jgi:hypothetical protein